MFFSELSSILIRCFLFLFYNSHAVYTLIVHFIKNTGTLPVMHAGMHGVLTPKTTAEGETQISILGRQGVKFSAHYG